MRRWISLLVVTALLAACSGGEGSDAPTSPTSADAAPTTESSSTTEGSPTTDTASPDTPGSGAGSGLVTPGDSPIVATSRWGPVSGGSIAILLQEGSGPDAANAVAEALGGTVIGSLERIDLYQVSIDAADGPGIEAAVDSALALDEVAGAFPGIVIKPRTEIWGVRTSPLDDPVYEGEAGRGYEMTGLEKAFEYVRGSGIDFSRVRVGILDGGYVNLLSEFLGPASITGDALGTTEVEYTDGTTGWDFEGHGVEVGSLVAANPDDGGVISPASIIGENLEVDMPNILVGHDAMSALDVLREQVYNEDPAKRASVINMSWGADANSLDPHIAAAYERFFQGVLEDRPDVIFVCAAGNEGQDTDANGDPFQPHVADYWPCGHELDNVITVGNVRNDGTTDPTSNRAGEGYEVTLAAPGSQAVRIDHLGNTVTEGGGTSCAAPQVTSAIALLKSLDPTLSAADIKDILTDTARTSVENPDGEPAEIDEGMGAGVLAIDKAVLEVVNGVRVRQGLDPLNPEELEQYGIVDALATSGEADLWLIQAFVPKCRDDCTVVSIHPSNATLLDDPPEHQLTEAGEVSWIVDVTEYPATVFVHRWDNGAGSLITIEPGIQGTWNGPWRLTEIVAPEGQTTPDGTPIEPGDYAAEDCAGEFGEALDAALTELFRMWTEEGFPAVLVFTETSASGGTVTFDGDLPPDAGIGLPALTGTWRYTEPTPCFAGPQCIGIAAEFADETMSMTVTGAFAESKLVARWEATDSSQPGLVMRGSLELTRAED